MFAYFSIAASPFGRLLVGLDGEAVVFARLARDSGETAAVPAGGIPSLRGWAAAPADHPVRILLQSFLDGEDVDPVDVPVRWPRATDFQLRVWRALRGVRRGRVVTYSDLAVRAGSPRAARAVGGAVSRNPLVLFVPCHRVVAAEGIGGFSAGLDVKRRWLELEGIPQNRLWEKTHEYSR